MSHRSWHIRQKHGHLRGQPPLQREGQQDSIQ
jgi:hypothetical protein